MPQKRSEKIESRRFGGRSEGPAAGARPLYRPAPAAVGHGARALPPWATALGILSPVATAVGA
jgi:hypothetical protein